MPKDEWFIRREQRLLNQLTRMQKRLANAKKQAADMKRSRTKAWFPKKKLSSKAEQKLLARIEGLKSKVDSIQLSLVEMREGGAHEEDDVYAQ